MLEFVDCILASISFPCGESHGTIYRLHNGSFTAHKRANAAPHINTESYTYIKALYMYTLCMRAQGLLIFEPRSVLLFSNA